MTATVEQLEREAREEGARRMTNIEGSITDMRKDINALTVTLARIDSNTASNSKRDTDIDDLSTSPTTGYASATSLGTLTTGTADGVYGSYSTSSAAYTISGSAGTVTVVNSCSNIISTGTNTSNSCSITGVTAGDLIVLCGIADSGVANSSLPMSDGTTSFTLTALQQSYNSGSPDSKYQDEQCGYLLSANPGNKTYTMTFADTVNNNYTSMFAVQLHSTVGTWHFDTSAGSSAAISANSSLNTGNFTTTGATEAVIWDTDLAFITATVSSPLIGSTTPNEFSFSPIGNNRQYYMFNTSFSGQAGTLTYSTPTYWQTTILALKAY